MPVPAAVARGKSTNVRLTALGLRASSALLAVLQRVAPALTAAWAERLFFTPPRAPLSDHAREVLRAGRPLGVTFAGRRLAAWRWGEGPTVLLVHGWGSRAAHLTAFVPPVVEAGFAAVAFDAPAHGDSPGRRTSIPAMAAALRAVVEATGPVAGVVAHSIGGPATAMALAQGLDAGRVVLLAPAADPDIYTARFAHRLGLDASTVDGLKARAERRLGLSWSDLHVPTLARALRVPALVVHDRADDEVPWTDGAAIAAAWPGAEMVTTAGLGHGRILRDPAVIARAVAFLSPGGVEEAAGCPHQRARRPCPACELEQELFDRSRRWRRAQGG